MEAILAQRAIRPSSCSREAAAGRAARRIRKRLWGHPDYACLSDLSPSPRRHVPPAAPIRAFRPLGQWGRSVSHLTPRPLSAPKLSSAKRGRGGEGVEKPKEAGGLRPPASLKISPLPRADALSQTEQFAGGGVRGGGIRTIVLFQQRDRGPLLAEGLREPARRNGGRVLPCAQT